MKVETFSDVDLILVPSKFLSEFYARRLGLPSQVIYPLFKSCHSLVTYRNPRFVTFINPVPQKGLTLFARIVAEALRKLPQAQFLVVEGRWKLDNVERAGLKLEKIPNVKVIPHQQDIKEVYAETRVLLFPSLEVEAFGRILVETQWNGIPILASRRGGIPEALNGGGFLFDIPDRCTENYLAIPTPEEVQPWIDQLRVLLEDQRGYEEAQRRAIQAAEAFSPERTIQTVINLFHRLLKK
jgi:glycosyltransferase involved in cell wall biosynthesis